jgi:hypothetical protein
MIRQNLYEAVASAQTLGGSYAKVGSAIDIGGYGRVTVHVTCDDTGDNAVLKYYVWPNPSASEPTDTTGGFQVVGSNGAEVEHTILTDESGAIEVPVSGKWLLIYGKRSASSGVDVTVYVTGMAAMI